MDRPVIAVIAALRAEGRVLARGLPVAGQARVGPLLVINCGVGPERAAAATAQALRSHSAIAVVSWGTTGALRAGLASGDLLVPRIVRDGSVDWPVDSTWHHRALDLLGSSPSVSDATLCHSDVPIGSARAKQDLAGASGGVAVDMESAAVLRVAADAGVPALVLRTIADDHGTALPPGLLACVDAYGMAKAGAVLGYTVANLDGVAELWRLRRAFRAGLAGLWRAAQRLGPDLAWGAAGR